MTTITREEIERYLSAAEMTQICEFDKGKLIAVTPEHMIKLARIALASLTSEPVLYAAEETLAYAKHGELHLTCLSEPMGDAVIPLYTAPPAPVADAEPVAWTSEEALAEVYCGETGMIGPQYMVGNITLYRHAQHAPVVPDERPVHTGPREFGRPQAYVDGWNACRAAMLQGAEPVSNRDELPDGYALVPIEPTHAMINAWLSEVANWRGHVAGYKAMLAAAAQQEAE